MCDVTYSVQVVREFFDHGDGPADLNKARVAFEVVMEAHEAIVEMLHAAVEKQHDAELALSALRHPSDSIDAMKMTLRRLAGLHLYGEPMSPAFEQVMDEMIAEVRLECVQSLSSPVGHGRAMA